MHVSGLPLQKVSLTKSNRLRSCSGRRDQTCNSPTSKIFKIMSGGMSRNSFWENEEVFNFGSFGEGIIFKNKGYVNALVFGSNWAVF